MKENYQENDYKVTDIIKESKSTPTGCYFDEVCNVAESPHPHHHQTEEVRHVFSFNSSTRY